MSLRDFQVTFDTLALMRQVSVSFFFAHSAFTEMTFLKCFPVASGALFLYDYLLTVGDEADLVWQGPWSIGKVLYLLARYPVFLDISMSIYHNVATSITPDTCALVFNLSGGAFMFGIIMAELIMAIRIWALWGNSRLIGASLGVCTVALAAIGAFFYGRFSKGLFFIDTSGIAPHLAGCLRGPGSRVLYAGYLGLAGYEALLFGLLLMKGARDFRHISTGFLYTFYQDGGSSFLPGFREAHSRPQLTLHSVLSTRMLLRLRKSAGNRPHPTNESLPFNPLNHFNPPNINTQTHPLPAPGSSSVSPGKRNSSEMETWFQGDVAGSGV
ncbi:hypothetical protein EYR38_005112 [Pleurotus pulmonarius]|nr:hypothetical protein EYR38_005112 [Pleurotus pulmonarius]